MKINKIKNKIKINKNETTICSYPALLLSNIFSIILVIIYLFLNIYLRCFPSPHIHTHFSLGAIPTPRVCIYVARYLFTSPVSVGLRANAFFNLDFHWFLVLCVFIVCSFVVCLVLLFLFPLNFREIFEIDF